MSYYVYIFVFNKILEILHFAIMWSFYSGICGNILISLILTHYSSIKKDFPEQNNNFGDIQVTADM